MRQKVLTISTRLSDEKNLFRTTYFHNPPFFYKHVDSRCCFMTSTFPNNHSLDPLHLARHTQIGFSSISQTSRAAGRTQHKELEIRCLVRYPKHQRPDSALGTSALGPVVLHLSHALIKGTPYQSLFA